MFCKKCGQEIKEGYKFCSKCGCPIELSNQQVNLVGNKDKENKKKPIKKIILIIMLLIVIGASSYFLINYIKLEKYKNNFINSISQYKLETYNKLLDDFERDWNSYKFFEIFKKDKALNEAQESYENLLDENEKEAKEKINDYKNTIKNISQINNEDKESYESIISKAEGLIDNNKYEELEEIYIELDNIIKTYENKNAILKLIVQQIDSSNYPNIKIYLKVEDNNTQEIKNNLDINYFCLSKKNNTGDYTNKKIEKVSISDKENGVYLIEFVDDNADTTLISDVLLEYKSNLYSGEVYCNYRINTNNDSDIDIINDTVDDSNIDPKLTVEGYIKGFDDAMTNNDFSYISSYLKPNSNIYNMQKKQVMKNVSEVLESYEILSLNYVNPQNCIIETREVYYVSSEDNKSNVVKQECKYSLEYIDGKWLMTDFVEPVKFID